MTKNKKIKAFSFGEVLWDVFPTHKKIGGAPLNVALRMQSLGADVAMISKVGFDEDGEAIVTFVKENGVHTNYIQAGADYKTGVVHVMVNEKGNASYDILYPSAWDKIKAEDGLIHQISDSDVFVFGSLSARDEDSRATLMHLLENSTTYKVFDVNLRAPYYTFELISHLMREADFIKLNDEELLEISQKMGSPYHSFEQNIKFIAKETNTKHICVTKGAFGAVLYYNDKFYYNSGYFIKVMDTVGAGDSFLASLLIKLLNGKSPQKALNFACAVGALVAGSEGANPALTKKDISKFMMLKS
ncbi:carbohydrate kinase family protein [Flavobacterium daejeonense]|uniref:carbohydrate kinase family protein n=1 Tax=Flavobacterium daejeonense TaxID=350893 RepID=UPI00047964A0|nr:carbohydrate kinase [Flavobacterium daejeonense]